MIKKLESKMECIGITIWGNQEECLGFDSAKKLLNKINELVDTVNELHEEAENNARIRANHEKLIDTLVVENNIHEKQIDELQMKLEPEKATISKMEKVETEDKDLSDRIGKLEIELDRTKKQMVTKCNQLEIAVDALETFAQIPQPIAEVAKVKLYAIKELEQKDK